MFYRLVKVLIDFPKTAVSQGLLFLRLKGVFGVIEPNVRRLG